MGMAKRQAEGKAEKKRRKAPEELRLMSYNSIAEGLDAGCLPLLENIYESTMPIVQVTFRIKDNGQWLSIAKRDTAKGPQVLFSGGDDFIEAIVRLSEKVAKGTWGKDTPYEERKKSTK